MGCKASKSANAGANTAVVTKTNPVTSSSEAIHGGTTTIIGKKGSVGSSSKSSNNSSSKNNNNNNNKQQQPSQSSSSHSPTAAKLRSGNTGNSKGSRRGFLSPPQVRGSKSNKGSKSQSKDDDDESSKVYNLILKAIASAASSGGSTIPETKSSTSETSSSRKKKNKRRDSKKNNVKNNDNDLDKIIATCTTKERASYRHPTTGYTPLHLVCNQLLSSLDDSSSKKQDEIEMEETNVVEDAETAAAVTNEGSAGANTMINNKMRKQIPSLVEKLIELYPECVQVRDKFGNIPFHYAIAPTPTSKSSNSQNSNNWKTRTSVVKLLLVSNLHVSQRYLLRTDVQFTVNANENAENENAIGTADSDDYENNNNAAAATTTSTNTTSGCGCSPLYHVIETLPDDFDPHGPTVEHMNLLRNCLITTKTTKGKNGSSGGSGGGSGSDKKDDSSTANPSMSYVVVSQPNDGDGDLPLALLYRRFTRQFDLAEKFFDGDNSRPEVVKHRLKYKTAAGNTWRIIELLLRPDFRRSSSSSQQQRNNSTWRIVHRAVQVETPPDLLRYIVETNAEDLTVPDEEGNLPLHYAASSKPTITNTTTTSSRSRTATIQRHKNHHHRCCYNTYTKYVMDELLYKFPEAASIPNSKGQFALYLAVEAGKPWIGGGIKSLYEAHPPALKQIDLKDHPNLKRALRADGMLLLIAEGDDDLGTTSYGSGGLVDVDESSSNNNYDDDDDDYIKNNSNEEAGGSGAAVDGDLDKEEKVDSPRSNINNSNTNASAASNLPGTSPRPPRKDKVIRDEPHDAIMRIQEDDVDVSEIVTNMWAHEEDPGVQMLGCVAITKLIMKKKQLPSSSDDPTGSEILRIALSAVAGVVNAMKAHPNEVIVQEKACHALLLLAPTDGQREVSFVASGAVSAIVGAMQAHVSDPAVQEQACGAVAEIVKYGGGERATIVASVSGLTAILNAIAAHPDVVGVQREGCRALMELTEYSSSSSSGEGGEESSSANLPELPRSQTEPLIEAAKAKFPNECGIAVDTILSRLTT